MSSTLTWAVSGDSGAASAATAIGYINDLETLIGTKSADGTFFWEVAGKNVGASPQWLLLRRKSGSAGRIAIINWSSVPAGVNTAILDVTPTNGNLFFAWFPAGTGTTLSNLTSASGTICGDDTNCVKVSNIGAATSAYQSPFKIYYGDCQEGMVFCTGNPASSTQEYLSGAGDLLVDNADVAYGCTFSYTNVGQNFGSTGSAMPYATAVQNSGAAAAAVIKTNYGSVNRAYFHAFSPTGWANVAVSSTDILTKTSAPTTTTAVAVPLVGQTKLEGFVLKLRQMGWGPGTTSAYTVYNISGPTVNMRQFCNVTVGANGFMWLTNFKL